MKPMVEEKDNKIAEKDDLINDDDGEQLRHQPHGSAVVRIRT